MATRRAIIERAIRQAYSGQPSDDAQVTFGLANLWLNDAIGVAAKTNYIDSVKLDSVAYINNSFVTTFTGLAIVQENIFTYSIVLPQIPVGIGQNEGIPSVRLQSSSQEGATGKSFDLIPLSVNQIAINANRRKIPNKYEYYYEGNTIYVLTTGQEINNGYTAIVRMVSGGDSTDLDSTLNIPDDYMPIINDYFKAQIGYMLTRSADSSNDGVDNNATK